jgi:hypothetical protein
MAFCIDIFNISLIFCFIYVLCINNISKTCFFIILCYIYRGSLFPPRNLREKQCMFLRCYPLRDSTYYPHPPKYASHGFSHSLGMESAPHHFCSWSGVGLSFYIIYIFLKKI